MVRRLLASCLALLVLTLPGALPARAEPSADATVRASTVRKALGRVPADGLGLPPAAAPGQARGLVHLAEARVDQPVGVVAVTMPAGSPDVEFLVRHVSGGRATEWTAMEPDVAGDPDQAVLGTAPTVVIGADTVQVVALSDEPVRAELALVTSPTTAADAAASGLAWQGPDILSRKAWAANESLVREPYAYADVTGAMVHHTAGSNAYTAEQVPAILRSIQAYHVNTRGWNDIAYNVLVDRFGRAWEGRGGGVDQAVQGGHAWGVTNARVFGVSLLGDYDVATPSAAMMDTTARVIAWKFRLHGVDPNTPTWGSGGQDGGSTSLPAISAHRDEDATGCPGDNLYARLGTIRASVAGYLSTTYTAHPLGGYTPGNLISDGAFWNASAMSTGGIGAFINDVGSECTPGPDGTPCLKNYLAATPEVPATQHCPRPISAHGSTNAAQMIADVAYVCGLNPQVLLVLIQREQRLLTASGAGLRAERYARATGVGCPDGEGPCDPATSGLFRQLYAAAEGFNANRANPGAYRHRVGVNEVRYHPDARCGTATLTIANQATAGLYNDTPYTPNGAALRAIVGTGDACAAPGHRDFYRYFRLWFPASVANSSAAPVHPSPASPVPAPGWFKFPFSATLFDFDGASTRATTWADWQASGFLSPSRLPAFQVVRYPWSQHLYAVSFIAAPERAWAWEHLSGEEWSDAGSPAPRSAGWIAGSTVVQWATSPELFLRELGSHHHLTFAEWRDTGYRVTDRPNAGFIRCGAAPEIYFVPDLGDLGRRTHLSGAQWRAYAYPTPQRVTC